MQNSITFQTDDIMTLMVKAVVQANKTARTCIVTFYQCGSCFKSVCVTATKGLNPKCSKSHMLGWWLSILF